MKFNPPSQICFKIGMHAPINTTNDKGDNGGLTEKMVILGLAPKKLFKEKPSQNSENLLFLL